jgi:hypothetical protein
VPLLIEIVGWAGAVLILAAYGLLSAGKLEARSNTYQLMNIVGAAGFVINSGSKGAYPSAVLNIIWIAIGVFAVLRSRRLAQGTIR